LSERKTYQWDVLLFLCLLSKSDTSGFVCDHLFFFGVVRSYTIET